MGARPQGGLVVPIRLDFICLRDGVRVRSGETDFPVWLDVFFPPLRCIFPTSSSADNASAEASSSGSRRARTPAVLCDASWHGAHTTFHVLTPAPSPDWPGSGCRSGALPCRLRASWANSKICGGDASRRASTTTKRSASSSAPAMRRSRSGIKCSRSSAYWPSCASVWVCLILCVRRREHVHACRTPHPTLCCSLNSSHLLLCEAHARVLTLLRYTPLTRLGNRLHPDKNKDDPDAQRKFQEMQVSLLTGGQSPAAAPAHSARPAHPLLLVRMCDRKHTISSPRPTPRP